MDPEIAMKMEMRLQEEVGKLKKFSSDLSALQGPRSKYLAQKNENELVKKELDLMEDGAVIYKLVGPVMIKQELDEVKSNVDGRLTYFNKELSGIEKTQKDLEEAQEKQRKTLMELQDVIRRTQQAAVQAQLKEQS